MCEAYRGDVAYLVQQKQLEIVGLDFVRPDKRVNAILELERVRMAVIRAQRRAMNEIDFVEMSIREP